MFFNKNDGFKRNKSHFCFFMFFPANVFQVKLENLPVQDEYFRWVFQLPKICHTYPTMMKLATVIPYLKMQKKYE